MVENNTNVAVKAKPMEYKKTQSVATPKPYDTAVTSRSIVDFFGDVKLELKKINWTSYDELVTYTKIVVGTTFFLGMGIYCADLLIQGTLHSLNAIIRWIA